MIKKLMMLCVATMAAMGAWAAFQCEVQVPAGDVGVSRTATVTYFNDGTDDIAAPYVRIEAGDNAYIRFSEADAWSKSVEFLATSDQLPVSSLRAGETVEIPVFVYTATQEAQMTLSYTQSSTEAFPWSDIGASLKPSYVSDSAWTFALTMLKSRFGTTWNSYLSRLRANADYLSENGRPVRRLDRLLQIEINHALGVDAVLPVLASVTDAARSARGMGLSFTRSYSSAMYGRFTRGILGYGWTDNFSTCAELSSDGKTLVFRVPGGGLYSFTKATGSWKPEDSRDKTVLSESSSAYTLTYQSGTVQTFAKSNMRTSTIADNSGNTLTFTWNGTTLQKLAHTDGQTLTFAYSGGLLSSVTDDCGRRTTYTYANSLLTKVTASDGLETLYEYRSVDGTAAARALSRIIYPDGSTCEFAYDTSSGLVTALSSNGGKETTTISRNGLNVTMTGPDGAATTVSMGVSGEVLKTTDALGGVSTKGYTADGLLKSVVSPSGLNGKIEHDALGRVSKSVSAAGTTTAFAYEDTFGNLKTVTDAKSHAVTYGYDAKGRGTSVTFADGSVSKLEYNSRGDVVKSTNRRGQTVTYAYDAKGRLTKKVWSTGRTFTYSYDARGNATTATDSETGTVAMQYDSADRLTKIVYPTGRGFMFAYDSCGRLAVRTSLDGSVEKFAYDAQGRLASVSDGNGVIYLQNTYDETTGRLTRQVNGNGTSVSYLYDKLGRVVSIEHSDADGKIVESLQYCYDADGRCIRASSLLGEERYVYDKDGQLTSVRYPDSPSEAFAYDAVGNRTIANGATYTVNNLNQYTEVVNAQAARSTITYDKDGNMTSLTDAKGTTTYTYDTLNRLVSVKNSTKGIDWSCQYDVFGNRVSVTDNGVTTERTYLQGSLPSVAAEYVNGQLKERHIVVGAVRVADISRTGGSPVQNEETRYYHADLIGSTRLVTDGNGDIVNRCAYKAFGETRIGEESACGYVGTLGVETDSTGLIFMRNRYYSPSLGRFIQMDPIGQNSGDVNVYRYCNNNGLQGVDPDGFEVLENIALMFDVDMTDPNAAPGLLGPSVTVAGSIVSSDSVAKMAERGTVALLVKETPSTALGVSYSNLGRKLVQVPASAVKKAGMVKSGVKVLGNAGTVWAWGESAYYNLYKKFDVMQFLADGVTGMYKGWFQIGCYAGYWATMGGIKIYKWLKPDKNIVVNVTDSGSGGGGGGSGGGGSGGGSGGGGAIMNESDWLDIATNKNAKTATYSLGADITLSNPKSYIGGFKGKFIGNGHKVTMNAGKAIFQDADGATFTGAVSVNVPLVWSPRNCTFENCSVTANISTGENRQKTGGFADLAIGCTFKNCSVDGTIVSSDWNVGGLVGEAENCTFDNCSSSATVTGPSYVGGVVGEARDCTFNKSRSTGTVTAAGWSGGFVGDAINCTFTKCRSAGNVIGKPSLADNSSTSACRIGGFVGWVESGCSFADCYSTATVSASDDEDVGGFAGFVDGDSTTSMVSFTRCYTTGAATGKTVVGGFAGHLEYCNMEDCYSKCTTTAIGEDIGSGITSAQLGGFVGTINDTRTTINLTRCYAMGKVNAPASSGYVSLVYAGGFSWYQDYITAANWSKVTCTDCYWDASGTGQSKSIFGKSLSASQINSRITSVSWYVDSQSQNASAASVRTAAYMSTQYKGLEESGVYTAEESPVHSQGASASENSLLMSAALPSFVLTKIVTAQSRLYCYERYVAVKGLAYRFALSADEDASISVSGLPSGFSFSNGVISGTASAAGTTTMTITANGSSGTTTKSVQFTVIEATEDFQPIVSLMSHPDLRPSMASGWSAPLVVSATSNTTYGATTFLDTDSLYVSWLIDCGNVNAEGTFYICLYVDDVLQTYWYTEDLPRDYYAHVIGYSLGTLSAGTHTVRIVTDATGAVAESNESNNSFETTITVLRDWFPNLSVSSLSASRTSIAISDSVTVHWRVENNDNGAADKSRIAFLTYKYDASSGEAKLVKTEWIDCLPLAAGGKQEFTKTINGKSLGEGVFSFAVAVDGDGTIVERSEADNVGFVAVSVSKDAAMSSKSSVDWQFTKKDKEADSFFLCASSDMKKKVTTFNVGQTIYMRCCFWNAKKGAVSGNDMRARVILNGGAGTYADGSYFEKNKYYYFSNTTPGFLQNLPAGSYTLTAVLDSENAWQETDEKNNVKTISFTVVGTPKIFCETLYKCALNEPVSWPVTIDGKAAVTGLPPGLKYSGGAIAGKATKTGTYTVNISTKNEAGSEAKSITIHVEDPGFIVSCSARPNGSSADSSVASGGTVEMFVGVNQAITLSSVPGKAGVANSDASVTAKGLPAGLKLSGGKITGVPTKAGTYAVNVSFKNKLSWTSSFLLNIVVHPLPDWAVGNFEGFVSLDENDGGFATMSITAAGKVTGKILYGGTNWTFKADSFAVASETVGYTNLALRTVATSGKATLNLSLNMVDFLVDSLPSSMTSFAEGYFGEVYTMMYRLPWKDKNDADATSLVASYAGAYSCKVPYGDDSGDVTFVLDEKGAVKGAVILPDGAKTRKATFSCNVLPNYDSLSVVIALPPDLKKGYPAVFKVVNLVNHSGEGADNLAFRDPGIVASVAELTAESGATGTVSVNPKYGQVAPGKDVTLTAKAAKGSVFHRWEITGVDTEGLDLSSSTLKIKMTDTGDVFAKAVFVTAEEDAASIALSVDALGGEISPEAIISVTNTCGVALKWSVAADALSKPVVAVTGLPSGLKFTAKDIMKKGSKTEVEIPANTIYGAPTAESKLNAKTGLRKPSAVKFTVTTAGKSKRVYPVEMTVLPLPAWAVGTFNGGGDYGQVSLTVAKTGKLSGKYLSEGLTWTLAADSFDSIDESGDVYRATLIGKSGKLVMTNEIGVAGNAIGGYAESVDYIAYQNNWKLEPWKTVGKPFAKAAALEYEDSASLAGVPVPGVLTLKFAASGAVTVKGSFVTGINEKTGKEILYSASGTAVLAPQIEPNEIGAFDAVVFVYLPPKAGKFDGYVRCIDVRWTGDGWIKQ